VFDYAGDGGHRGDVPEDARKVEGAALEGGLAKADKGLFQCRDVCRLVRLDTNELSNGYVRISKSSGGEVSSLEFLQCFGIELRLEQLQHTSELKDQKIWLSSSLLRRRSQCEKWESEQCEDGEEMHGPMQECLVLSTTKIEPEE